MDQQKLLKHMPILIVVLLLIPYMGDVGALIFSHVGKKYYIAVSLICMFALLCNFTLLQTKKNYKYVQLLIASGLLFLMVAIILKNAVDSIFFGLILFLFFAYYFISYDKQVLNGIGIVSNGFLWLFLLISVIKKCEYFNPNSYAFISTELYLWSIYYVINKKDAISKTLCLVNTLVAVWLVYFIYNSATQLICVGAFFVLVIIRNIKPANNKVLYNLAITGVFALVCILPFIVVVLINKGVLGFEFFTNRGERWFLAINAIKEAGIFSTADASIGAHNGFLEMSLTYTTAVAISYLVMLYLAILSCYNIYKRYSDAKMLVIMFMVYMLMNISESFFIGLTDAYFFIIIFASLMSYKNSILSEHQEMKLKTYERE